MDSSGVTPTLKVPRLRLSRLGLKYDELDTPQAGPSRLSPGSRTPTLNGHYDSDHGDDAQSTPRMPMLNTMALEPTSASATPIAETPSARLRALLARVPHSPSTPKVEQAALSDTDSDFDPPRSSPLNTPSIARESLKDLFSRARRDPGDTPQKTGRRRNSIDVSEVEASPRAERERARNRGQRRSLSDEEAEKQTHSVTSSRASQAATFDILRARLSSSQTQIMNQQFGDPESGAGLPDTSTDNTDNESFLRGLEQAPTSPVATSTPQRTMQMPSEIQFQSNLLEHDSDMRDAMKDIDSFEGSSRPVSFPPARPSQAAQSVPGRPLSLASGSKVHSMSRTPGTRPRVISKTSIAELDHSHSSRASSSLSQPDFREKDHGRPKEQVHQREREWNRPHAQPKTPESHRHSYSSVESHSSGGSKGGSPMFNLTNRLGRRDSVTSLKSMDDNRSSHGSSIGSQADYRERISELEKDRNTEREREWNKRPTTSRPTSSMSMNSNSNSPRFERSRTLSQPMRPDSALGHTPDNSHPSLYRNHSFHSPGSRASSRNSSISHGSSKEEEEEIQHEVDHTRERNWNSRHPHWDPNDRAISPSLRASEPRPSVKHSHSLSYRGTRPESPTAHLQNRSRSSLSYSSLNASGIDKDMPPAESTTPQGAPPLVSQLPNVSRPRSHSHTSQIGNSSSASHASPLNRFGWQFPLNKTRLPPIDFDEHSPERQASDTAPGPSPSPSPVRSTHKASTPSHIPIRAHKTPDVSRTMDAGSEPAPRGLGHRRSVTVLNESNGRIPPAVNGESVASPYEDKAEDDVFSSDEDAPSPLRVDAVALQATELPEEADVPMIFSPPVSPEAKPKNDSPLFRNVRPPSPPPLPEFTLSLATPPRPQSANSSRPVFQTPPTPADLPRLPEPPSDDESDAEWTPEPLAHLDFSAMKTPKPPGGWNFTPIAPHRDPLTRAFTQPDSDAFGGGSSSENGLSTPLPSLSRASTLPFQTPAPPGAWMNTPGSEKRKSIMKVRFDVESEQSASEAPNGRRTLGDLDGLQLESPSDLDLTPTIKPMSIPASPTEIIAEVVVPVTPRTTPPSSIRRSPIVRVVDAFGREQKAEDAKSKQNTPGTQLAPPTPRSRSSVRIVDAMGREVDEKIEEEPTMTPASDEELLSHNEALKRVRQSIADLALGLSDVESSSNEREVNNVKMSELNGISQAARDARRRLEETLRIAHDTELELRSKIGLKAIQSNLQYRRAWRPFIFGALALQVTLIFVVYRFSAARAKATFLSTYYDPYYPGLHLYVTKPDMLRLSMEHTARWSLSSIPSALYHGGLKAVADDAWRGLAMTVYDLQKLIWDTWGTPDPVSWPPT